MKQQSCAQVDARLQGVTAADHSRHDMQRGMGISCRPAFVCRGVCRNSSPAG